MSFEYFEIFSNISTEVVFDTVMMTINEKDVVPK